MRVILLVLPLSFLLFALDVWCGRVRRETLFLHTQIATNYDLTSDSRDDYFSKFLNGPIAFTDVEYDMLETWLSVPELGYLCRNAL